MKSFIIKFLIGITCPLWALPFMAYQIGTWTYHDFCNKYDNTDNKFIKYLIS